MYKIVLFSAAFTGLSVASGFALSIANQHIVDYTPKTLSKPTVVSAKVPVKAIVNSAPLQKSDTPETLVETVSLETFPLKSVATDFADAKSDLAPVFSPRPIIRGNAPIAVSANDSEIARPVEVTHGRAHAEFDQIPAAESYQVVQSYTSFPDYQPSSRRGKNVKPKYLIGVYR